MTSIRIFLILKIDNKGYQKYNALLRRFKCLNKAKTKKNDQFLEYLGIDEYQAQKSHSMHSN